MLIAVLMDPASVGDSANGRPFNPCAFASQKVVLVDDSNFLAWQQHVLLVLKTYWLHSFVDGTIKVPLREVTGSDGASIENLTYAQYEQQDSALCAWLLSTVSALLHNQLVGHSLSAFELWETLKQVFGS